MNSETQQVPAIMQFLPIIFVFIVFYFVLIRPQQKRQKEHAAMLAKIDKNDEIITAGGVHATVVAANEKTLTVRIAENVKVELERSSVSQVVKSRQQAS